MAVQTLILAGNPREGREYANRAQLRRWTYRVIHGPGQIKGLPWSGAEVHILPSFDTRANRAAILSVLRWKRVDYFYVDPDDFPTLDELAESKQADQLGELDDDVLEAAYAEQAEFPHATWAAARRREKIAEMSDEDLAKMLSTSADAPQLVKEIKAVEAAKPKPRKPAPKPAPDVDSAADFFARS